MTEYYDETDRPKAAKYILCNNLPYEHFHPAYIIVRLEINSKILGNGFKKMLPFDVSAPKGLEEAAGILFQDTRHIPYG